MEIKRVLDFAAKAAPYLAALLDMHQGDERAAIKALKQVVAQRRKERDQQLLDKHAR